MALEVKDLSVAYRMRRTGERLLALHGLTFSVRQRSFVCIVGPSGCGKTSLLKAVAGLTPPTSGEILLDGTPLARPGMARAMVFQSPSLLPWRPVLANVAYGLELQGLGKEPARQRALEQIDRVGLTGFEDSYPGELSLGMQQRVNLARALATEPEVLLMDEPFAALDAQTRLLMQLELQSIWERTGSTALFVTHQITEAILLGDQVIVLSGRPGKVRALLEVPLPRPREREMKRWPAFTELEEQIWDLIQEEAASQAVPARLAYGA